MNCEPQNLKQALVGGLSWLRQHEALVNQMNVFPVPDGDTGTNMLLTLQRAVQHLRYDELNQIGALFERLAEGALIGARGNSGTILAYLLRGFALGMTNAQDINPTHLALATQSAVDYAYHTVQTVMQPVEGTILTVARACAEALRDEPLPVTPLACLAKMVEAAWEAVQRTPQQLPRLREANVVDSGGLGLAYWLDGLQRVFLGQTIEAPAASAPAPYTTRAALSAKLDAEDERGYGYDVQFLMLGQGFNVDEVRRAIASMGWSALVDGTDRLIKVHVHVYDPSEPIGYAVRLGAQLDEVVVENMQRQYQDYLSQRATSASVGVVAVADGAGLARLLRELGAGVVISGGQTMNPSAEDFLRASASLPQSQIILLPNNPNARLAAEQAAQQSSKQTRVLPTRSVQQGLAALLAYADQQSVDLDALHTAMQERLSGVVSLAVTYATRSGVFDGLTVQKGDCIGLIDDELRVRADTLSEAALALTQAAVRPDHELLTLYWGAQVSQAEAENLAASLSQAHPRLTLEVLEGNQALYPYLFSLE
ncbi:MAG: DAK2 domain-containing protein [Anaerolineae bacterium]|nr:DAK2 domain-containing protein [Anaerolineae bacterium]MDW8172445.1 DAK2 domain-containing protein [Anaerolineae bacterium]